MVDKGHKRTVLLQLIDRGRRRRGKLRHFKPPEIRRMGVFEYLASRFNIPVHDGERARMAEMKYCGYGRELKTLLVEDGEKYTLGIP